MCFFFHKSVAARTNVGKFLTSQSFQKTSGGGEKDCPCVVEDWWRINSPHLGRQISVGNKFVQYFAMKGRVLRECCLV